MAEFRAATGLVSVTPHMRASAGLVLVGVSFFGTTGPVDSGGRGALTVAASPSAVYGNGRQAQITTGITTAAVTGGTAPYAYAWTIADALGDWSITTPANATTAFQIDNADEGDPYSAFFTVTATDANGVTGTATVEAQIYRYGANNGQL